MILKPSRELFSSDLAVGEIEHQTFLLIDVRAEFRAVQQQENFHRRMGHSLIAVHERVVQGQREAESRRFLNQRGMEVFAVERRSGLRQG